MGGWHLARWRGRRGLDEEDVGVADVLAELDVALAVVEAPDGRLPARRVSEAVHDI